MGIFSFLFSKKSNKTREYFAKDAVILDVRTQQEYEDFHFAESIHIPISELKNRISEIKDLNKPIVAHCKSGVRSERAKQILINNGIDAINGGGLNAIKMALEQH